MMIPIRERNILLCIILTILTCGIYGLIWFVSITDDMKKVSGHENLSGGLALLLIFLTCGIYTYFWAWNMGKANNTAKLRHGMMVNSVDGDSILYLILSLFGFGWVVYCLVQSDLNKYAKMQITNFNNQNNGGYQVN